MEQEETSQVGERLSVPLEIDEQELRDMSEERGAELVLNDELRLFACQNTLEIRKESARRTRADDGKMRCETKFRIAAHPHPSCRFISALVAIDLSYSPGAVVQSIDPENAGAHVVEHSETISPAFKATLPGNILEVSLGSAKQIKYIVTIPEVVGSRSSSLVTWAFSVPSLHHELRIDRHLGLGVEFPPSLGAVRAELKVTARVTFRGFSADIPLVGRRTGTEAGLIRLDE
jgi:hypothetical protein